MNQIEQWNFVKRFRNILADGNAAQIACPNCGNDLIFMAEDVTDNPVLYCYMEGSTLKPGLNVWNQINAVVSEHYVE